MVSVLSGMDPWTMTPEQLISAIQTGSRAHALIDPLVGPDPHDRLHTIEPRFPAKKGGAA